MKKNRICLFVVLISTGFWMNVSAQSPPNIDENWELNSSLSDEFTSLDLTKWHRCYCLADAWGSGSGCWGEGGMRYSHAYVDGGILKLKVETLVNSYTPSGDLWAGGIYTNDFSYSYGYYEIRAKLPGYYNDGESCGQGFWPCFWTYYTDSVNPATNAYYTHREFDILEPSGTQYADGKTNVSGWWTNSPITSQTGNLFKLRSVSYNLNTAGLKSANNVEETETMSPDKVVNKQEEQDSRIHYGFIAQEVKEIYPELVYEDKEGILGIDYVSFIPLLVAELKQQTETINSLKQEIETLKATNGNTIVTNANQSFGELYQNYPNPFDESTIIKFRLSGNVNSAAICLYDLKENQLKSYSKSNANESLEIKATELRPEMYLYSLITNGNLIDTKTMILTE